MKIKVHQNNPLFFSADCHFFHSAILKFSKRPFENVEEMNEKLIEKWNEKIPKQSTVFFLGDFSFGNEQQSIEIFNRLNGEKHLVIGNHDRFVSLRYWKTANDVSEFNYNGYSFFLSHYSHKVWNRSHYGSIHLFGHSHNSLPDDPTSRSMDVGIDAHPNLEPFSLEEVLENLSQKTFKPIDHHGDGE
jgi:calcineurin-like phosphoesterase family protein